MCCETIEQTNDQAQQSSKIAFRQLVFSELLIFFTHYVVHRLPYFPKNERSLEPIFDLRAGLICVLETNTRRTCVFSSYDGSTSHLVVSHLPTMVNSRPELWG